MTAIERTAYPRFKQSLTQDELEEFYVPTEAEVVFVHQAASGKLRVGNLPRLNKRLMCLGE
jgi:hypothetical protein